MFNAGLACAKAAAAMEPQRRTVLIARRMLILLSPVGG
jgi:hypothetical protein